MVLDGDKDTLRMMRVKITIAKINDRQMIKWINPNGKCFSSASCVEPARMARGFNRQPDLLVTAQSWECRLPRFNIFQ